VLCFCLFVCAIIALQQCYRYFDPTDSSTCHFHITFRVKLFYIQLIEEKTLITYFIETCERTDNDFVVH